jgi:3-hydroxyisobutyrate dehydrogenase-like beta-hydroxyacid dehydrogenase
MRIGFIGLGNMGGPMSLNLIKAGHSLVITDLRREIAQEQLAAGAKWVDSGAAVARDCEIVFTSLPGPREVEAVVMGEGGISHGLAPGQIYVDLSTNSVTTVRRLHGLLAAKGIPMLDAPVSGGVQGAKAATLAVYVGGDEAIYNKVKPVLDGIGDKVMYLGPVGNGTVAKLVHNMIGVCVIKVMSEAFTLGVKGGVPAETLLKAVESGAYGRGRGMLGMMPNIIGPRDFEPARFALRLARKDLGLATELARELNVPMEAAALVEQDMAELMRRGNGDKDFIFQFTLQEERAGVKVS